MSTKQTASAARVQAASAAAKRLATASQEFQDAVTHVKNEYPKLGRCSGNVFYYDQDIAPLDGISKREVAETVASLEREGYVAVPAKSMLTISWCTPADLVPKK